MTEVSRRDKLVISTEKNRLILSMIHSFLSQSYWAKDISKKVVSLSIENSLCFGLYDETTQIGFARVITDYATFAYLCDLFIVESQRNKGLGKWLVESVRNHSPLKAIPVWLLATRDAHGLYSQIGFTPLSHPDYFMQINKK